MARPNSRHTRRKLSGLTEKRRGKISSSESIPDLGFSLEYYTHDSNEIIGTGYFFIPHIMQLCYSLWFEENV
jgi:hypothetical protein